MVYYDYATVTFILCCMCLEGFECVHIKCITNYTYEVSSVVVSLLMKYL